MIPELHTFVNPRLRRFQASENRELPVPEKHAYRTLSNPDISRVTGFPEFPNRTPTKFWSICYDLLSSVLFSLSNSTNLRFAISN
jgi:hypothetical protein